MEAYVEAFSIFIGFFVTLSIFILYFGKTNKSGVSKIANSLDIQFRRKKINAVRVIRKLNEAKKNKFSIRSYLDTSFRVKKVNNNVVIFDRHDLIKIIDQHHLNAIIVEIFLFAAMIALGFFKDRAEFQIPAMASGFLLFSFFTMFTGAFSYWFRGWAITGIIIIFLALNFFTKYGILSSNYDAFGLNYKTERVDFSTKAVIEMNSKEQYLEDKQHTIEILEKWKSSFPDTVKPKIVLVCASGGGQRSALWTMHTLQYVDSSLSGKLFKHTRLITGASGGLIGASYFRELYLRKLNGEVNNIYDEKYAYNVGKDLLNPMIFSMVVSDFFLRFQKFEYNGHSYYKGRGYAFEEKLNENLGNVFDKRIIDYRDPEQDAIIPMMILSPTVINDGRKLHISPQPISYMNIADPDSKNLDFTRCKGIEFMRFFKDQEAEDLRFLSALRMSATFPYITPNVDLPSTPMMEIMDAGLSDNFGVTDAVRFSFVFKDWIEQNTSGIVMVMIRDSENDPAVEKNVQQSLWTKLFNPIGSIYNNWEYVQDFNNENQIEYLKSSLKSDLDIISFQYIPKPKDWKKLEERNIDYHKIEKVYADRRASLSWHLTKREKESIIRTINEDYNQQHIQRLKELLAN